MKTSPEELEQEVESIRADLGPIVSELGHRGHELTDWKVQLRRRGPALLKGAAALAGLIVAVKLIRKRRARFATRRRALSGW